MKKDDLVFLEHMLERAYRIQRHTTGGREDFMQSELLQDMAMRSFEIIGEAAGRTSIACRDAHPAIPWQQLVNFRNVLIHRYAEIDLESVWKNIAVDLPPLITELEEALRASGDGPESLE